MSYVDDDLMIVRSLGGQPDVLMREEKAWMTSGEDDGWEGVPDGA